MEIPMMTRTNVQNMIAVLGIDQGARRFQNSAVGTTDDEMNSSQDIRGGKGTLPERPGTTDVRKSALAFISKSSLRTRKGK
jgi:hypothetical protein